MGIEKFFNSLIKKDNRLNNNVIVNYKPKIKYLYVDFNSILYKIAEKIEHNLNNLLYELLFDGQIHSDDNKHIADLWNFDSSVEFGKYFTDDLIKKYFLKEIDDDLNYIYDEIINNTELEYIYISIDGTPNMAKIVEQKKRRYNNYIIGSSKKYILEKYINNLSEKRLIYEKNKIKVSRGKFFSSDSFMENVTKELESKNNQIHTKYPKLKQYTVSGSNVPGEGEKKIMENITDIHNDSGTIAIYSPDSDMIILSSILFNTISINTNMYTIRYDQQSKNHDIVHVNILINNINKYTNTNGIDTINDIMFIFNIFGNDFIHKIESVDAKKDSDLLLDIYIKTIMNNKKNIIYDGKINYDILVEYFEKLSIYEKDLVNDTYLSKNYKNYRHLKTQFMDLFWYKTLHKTLVIYFTLANVIYKNIDDIKKNGKNCIHDKIKNIGISIGDILKSYDNDIEYGADDFFKIFTVLELGVPHDDIDNIPIYDTIANKIIGDKKIVPNIRLDRYSYTANDKFHTNRIKENMPHGMEITDMDKDIYSFEFMLDKYKHFLNADDDGIGKCELKYVNNRYVYMYDSNGKYRKKFYKLYMDKNHSIDDLCKKYIEGMLWLHDFYYIKNDAKYNYKNVSIWFYDGAISPLLVDIYEYIKKISRDDFDNMHNNIVRMVVDRKDFLDGTRHYLYVTPKNNILSNYRDDKHVINYVNKNLDIYPDLDKYALNLLNNIDTKKIINCGRATYLSKCILVNVKDLNYKSFMHRIIKNNM